MIGCRVIRASHESAAAPTTTMLISARKLSISMPPIHPFRAVSIATLSPEPPPNSMPEMIAEGGFSACRSQASCTPFGFSDGVLRMGAVACPLVESNGARNFRRCTLRLRDDLCGHRRTSRFFMRRAMEKWYTVPGAQQSVQAPGTCTSPASRRLVSMEYISRLCGMTRFVKKRSVGAGLAPGTPVYVGEKRDGGVRITIIDYDEAQFQEKEVLRIQECFSLQGQTVGDMDQCGRGPQRGSDRRDRQAF